MESLYSLLGISPDCSDEEIGNAIEKIKSTIIDIKVKNKIIEEARKMMQLGRSRYDEINKFDIENEQAFSMVNNHQQSFEQPKPYFGIKDERAKLRKIRQRKRQASYKDIDEDDKSLKNK